MMRRTIVAVSMLVATRAHADDHKVADDLFAQAQAKRTAGDEAGACKLFEESLAKNKNAVGTILNVALCEEKAGKLTAAHHRFRDARDRAREQGLDEHIAASEQHMTDLASRVGYVTLAFVEAPSPSVSVTLDGDVVDHMKREEIMVDPGAHEIRVTSPGRVPHGKSFTIAAAEHVPLAIPVLATPGRGNRLGGKVLTAGGFVLVGAGVVLGFVAKAHYDREFDEGRCVSGSPPLCTAEGYVDTGNARQLGTIATVVGGVGLVTAGVGLYLWLRPGPSSETRTAVTPTLGNDSIGVAAAGRF